jgi:hypothetical protein
MVSDIAALEAWWRRRSGLLALPFMMSQSTFLVMRRLIWELHGQVPMKF